MSSRKAGPLRAAREQEAHRLLREVVSATRAHQSDVEQSAGLSAAQVRLLTVVKQHPQCSVGECAGYLGLSMPTVSNLLRVAVARKWIRTVTDAADRRRLRLQLSPSGAMRIGKAIPFAAGMLPAVIGSLSAASLRRLNDGLGPLVAAIPAEYRAAAQPTNAIGSGDEAGIGDIARRTNRVGFARPGQRR